ncbi:MAG: TerB family tellurite resistance protein [Rhodomicrobium sp.]
MSIWGKLTGAAARIGGPIGALLSRLGPELDKQVAFTVGVIALGAKMAKADGIVTRDEVEAFKEVFKIPPGEEHNVARLFNLAKQDVAGFEMYARQLNRLFHDDRQLLTDVMDGLFHIAAADGRLHPNEERFLASVAKEFGIGDREFLRIKGRHFKCGMYDPYNILQSSAKASDAELKVQYHKLVAANHPDMLIARGVPPEFIDIATKKLAAINAAYEEIRAARRVPH